MVHPQQNGRYGRPHYLRLMMWVWFFTTLAMVLLSKRMLSAVLAEHSLVQPKSNVQKLVSDVSLGSRIEERSMGQPVCEVQRLENQTVIPEVSNECKAFLESLENRPNGTWKWYRYASETVDSGPKTLVAHHSGPSGDYARMLEITSRVGRAYARSWKYDYATFKGIYYGCVEWHSAYNKIGVLKEARAKGYETVLLMDADALIVNMSMPVNYTLSSPNTLVNGQWAGRMYPWSINNGVMAWNLKHPISDAVVDLWRKWSLRCLRVSANGWKLVHPGDQKKLLSIFREYLTVPEQYAFIKNSTSLFKYRQGTFVKHFIRPKPQPKKGWDVKSSAASRVVDMEEYAKIVCDEINGPGICDDH